MVTTETAAPTTILFSEPQDPAAVRGAIARALDARGFQVEGEAESRITASYNPRGARMRLAIDYGSERAVISYLDGEGVTERRYLGWMRSLENTIRDQLAAPPAPEPVVAEAPPEESGPEPMTVMVEPARELGEVRGAVSRALAARRYIVESEEGQRIVARYSSGGSEVRIAIDYAPERAVITYVDSENAELSRYDGWMRSLQQALQQELGN